MLGPRAGSGQQENQFSKAFLACFHHSEFFRLQWLPRLIISEEKLALWKCISPPNSKRS